MLSVISESVALEITNCPIAKSPFILRACSSFVGIVVAAPIATVSGVTGFDLPSFGKYQSTLISSIPRPNSIARGSKFFIEISPCNFVLSNSIFIFFVKKVVVLPTKLVLTATRFKASLFAVFTGFLLSVFNNACRSNGAIEI